MCDRERERDRQRQRETIVWVCLLHRAGESHEPLTDETYISNSQVETAGKEPLKV